MGFHHLGQAGLELLTLNEQPALASQSPGLTGVSYCAQPVPSLEFHSLSSLHSHLLAPLRGLAPSHSLREDPIPTASKVTSSFLHVVGFSFFIALRSIKCALTYLLF